MLSALSLREEEQWYWRHLLPYPPWARSSARGDVTGSCSPATTRRWCVCVPLPARALSFGGDLTVLEPAWLREGVVRDAERTVAQWQAGDNGTLDIASSVIEDSHHD
jgi:hypothetical protein